MKNKKLLGIIIGIVLLLIILLVIFMHKSQQNKSISIEMILPSQAKVTYDPILEDVIEVKVGNIFTVGVTLNEINNDDYLYVIKNDDIISVENNKVKAEKPGTAYIHCESKNGKVKSNELKIKVVE